MRPRSGAAISPSTSPPMTAFPTSAERLPPHGPGVAAAGESREGVARKRRPALRHVEAAVAGKAGKERVGEADRGRLTAGGDVQHGRPWGVIGRGPYGSG